jgi:glycine oxidase
MDTYDAVIIGGGLIGASTAFELAREKLRVVLLDRQQPGHEASPAAGGMLSPESDGPEAAPVAPLAKESLKLYPGFIASIEELAERRTFFKLEGALELFLAPHGEAERDKVVAEHCKLGFAAEPIPVADAARLAGAVNPAVRAAAWFPEEGTLEPRPLMDAVLVAAQRRGVEIRSDCPVTSLLREGDRCTGVMAGGKKIWAKYIVVAAGCFSGLIARETDWFARYAPTRPVRGQILILRAPGTSLQRVVRSERRYLVPRSDGSILAGSTLEDAGFKKHLTPAGVRRITEGALDLVPGLADAEIVETWAGLRPGTPDNLPILGPTDMDGLLMATGHYRSGLLLAPVTARLMREWIIRRQVSLDTQAFSPLRFGAGKASAGAAKTA